MWYAHRTNILTCFLDSFHRTLTTTQLIYFRMNLPTLDVDNLPICHLNLVLFHCSGI